jgi:hypothetical protein
LGTASFDVSGRYSTNKMFKLKNMVDCVFMEKVGVKKFTSKLKNIMIDPIDVNE